MSQGRFYEHDGREVLLDSPPDPRAGVTFAIESPEDIKRCFDEENLDLQDVCSAAERIVNDEARRDVSLPFKVKDAILLASGGYNDMYELRLYPKDTQQASNIVPRIVIARIPRESGAEPSERFHKYHAQYLSRDS